MRETERKQTITDRLRRDPFNCFVINLTGSQMQMPGLPDTLVIKDGIHLWIEFKGELTKIRLNQTMRHKEMAKQQIHVFIVRFVSEHEWIIDELYSIKFKRLQEGVQLLFDTLLELQNDLQKQKGGINFPSITSASIGQSL